jgi:hypothetical protein
MISAMVLIEILDPAISIDLITAKIRGYPRGAPLQIYYVGVPLVGTLIKS